jgi:ParB family transcriptional regulator, chromosome partitioning protein
MQSPCALIGLHELDLEDHRFAIRSFLPHHRLEASLSHVGILSPPWVRSREDRKYTVVDGFKRLHWAREAGLEAVACLVFPENCRYEDILLLRIEGKLFGPPLNAAEKAQIIAKSASALPSRFIVDHILPAFGIPQRDDAPAKWCGLSAAGEQLLMAAAAGKISERTALELSTWGEEEGAEILIILEELRCSASTQMEIIERVTEIALREDRQRLGVLRQPELQVILKEQCSNYRQKSEALRALLTRWRFPRLSAREEDFAQELKETVLPGAVRLVHPPAFEGERWQLEIAFSSPEKLQVLLEKALEFARSSSIRSIMN